MSTELMGAVSIRRALEPDLERVERLCSEPADPLLWESSEKFRDAQDLVATWVASWLQASQKASTSAGRSHVDNVAGVASKAKNWLVASVRKLAYSLVDNTSDVADELVQEMLLALLVELPRFDVQQSHFGFFAAQRMKFARGDAFERVSGWSLAGTPESWKQVGLKVRGYLNEGSTLEEAVTSTQRDYFGEEGSPEYDKRYRAHKKGGRVSALNQIDDVLLVTQHPLALDSPTHFRGNDGRGAEQKLHDVVSAPAVVKTGTSAGLVDRFADMCGVGSEGVGAALHLRFETVESSGKKPSLNVVSKSVGVRRSEVQAAEDEAKRRAMDPLAWMVWLDDTYVPDAGHGAGEEEPVVW